MHVFATIPSTRLTYTSQSSMLHTPAQCSFPSLSTVTDSIYTKVIPREGKDREHTDKGRYKASASLETWPIPSPPQSKGIS